MRRKKGRISITFDIFIPKILKLPQINFVKIFHYIFYRLYTQNSFEKLIYLFNESFFTNYFKF